MPDSNIVPSVLQGKTAPIPMGLIEIQGILTTCGKYFVAIPQMVEADLVEPKRGLERLEAFLGIEIGCTKIKTDLNPKAVNCVTLADFKRIIKASTRTEGVPRSTCTQVSGGRNSREKTIAPPTNSTSAALDKRGGV